MFEKSQMNNNENTVFVVPEPDKCLVLLRPRQKIILEEANIKGDNVLVSI